MYGGRLAGQGTYGCVFQPTLLCSGSNPKRDSSKVGKITTKQDAKNELQISAYIHTLPDAHLYTVVPDIDSCIPQSRSKQSDPGLSNCEFLETMPLERTVQLVLPWGGNPLSKINLKPDVFDYYQCVEDVLAVGAFFVLNDLCHFDIWGQNVLFDRANKPRLIDYGFSFQASKLVQHDLSMRWREIGVDHDTETPEVTLMIGTQHGLQASSLAREVQLSKPAVQRLSAICGLDATQWVHDLVTWTETSQSFQQHDWLTCWKLYWPGFDAWSIGAMLLQILEIQLGQPAFVNDPRWNMRSDDIKRVLTGLCHGSPALRLDAAEALSLWTNRAHPLIADGLPGSDWVEAKQNARLHATGQK